MKSGDIIVNKETNNITMMVKSEKKLIGTCTGCHYQTLGIIYCPKYEKTNTFLCNLPENKKLVFKDITDLL